MRPSSLEPKLRAISVSEKDERLVCKSGLLTSVVVLLGYFEELRDGQSAVAEPRSASPDCVSVLKGRLTLP